MTEPDYLKRPEAQGHLKVMEALRRWDPIGEICADNQDEYDAYAPDIVRLLDRGVTTDQLAAHLEDRRKDMGVSPNPASDRKIAAELVEWWIGWKKG